MTKALKAKHALGLSDQKEKELGKGQELIGRNCRFMVSQRMMFEACIELAKIYEHRIKRYINCH